MNSNFSGPIRWRGAVPTESGPPKSNWTLIPGNVARATRWISGGSGVTTVAGTSGHNSWNLIQGHVVDIFRWKSRIVPLSQPGSFSVVGDISATFAPASLQGFRVEGDIAASFIAGGSVTIAGGFTHTGEVVASFLVSAVAGYRVEGEVIPIFYRRAGQQSGCVSGPGQANLTKPKNAVH